MDKDLVLAVAIVAACIILFFSCSPRDEKGTPARTDKSVSDERIIPIPAIPLIDGRATNGNG